MEIILPIKLLVIIICSVLFWWGGYSWKPARRFIMPFICATVASLATINVLVGVCMLLAILPLCLGYGKDSYLKHVFGNGWGRGVWGGLVASCLSIPLFLTHHILILFLISYLIVNFSLENLLKNINQMIGDPIIGLGLASIILLIH